MIYGQIIDKNLGLITINSYLNLFKISKILNKYFPQRSFIIICGFWWSIESIPQILKLIKVILTNKFFYKNVEFHFLCNTKMELKIIQNLKLSGIYCNHNCFIDENIFTISNNLKSYTVVYNGVLEKFKRHFLMKNLNDSAIVTYNFKNVKLKTYLDSILPKSTHWLNYFDNGTRVRFLSEYELCQIYGKSKIGLALSEKEGAMYASGEYLLCGIPIVSTKSKGGRDVFFDSYNSIQTKANPISIYNAVEDLVSKNQDPFIIRNNFLKISNNHRNEFIKLLNKIAEKNNVQLNIKLELTTNEWYINKLRNDLSEEFLKSQLS